MATEFNFMSELQKKILDQIVKGGLAVLLLVLFAWYQTNKLDAQEVKFETRVKELENGLLDCEKARASLSTKVQSLEEKISAFVAARRR